MPLAVLRGPLDGAAEVEGSLLVAVATTLVPGHLRAVLLRDPTLCSAVCTATSAYFAQTDALLLVGGAAVAGVNTLAEVGAKLLDLGALQLTPGAAILELDVAAVEAEGVLVTPTGNVSVGQLGPGAILFAVLQRGGLGASHCPTLNFAGRKAALTLVLEGQGSRSLACTTSTS